MGDAAAGGTQAGEAAPELGAVASARPIAERVISAMGSDPTQVFILLDRSGVPTWASQMLTALFDVDFAAANPLTAAMHPEDASLVEEIFSVELTGRADETYDFDRRFELLVRLRSPRGDYRWVAVRLHNRLDDPGVDGMVLQLTLANQEFSTVEAFDAAALGAPTAHTLELVLRTLTSGGTADAQAVVFDIDGCCVAATPGARIDVGASMSDPGWQHWSRNRVDLSIPVIGPHGVSRGTLVTVSNFPDLRPFTKALTAAVARRVGLVLDAEHDREELRRRAISDPLTGLHNRRYLYDHLGRDDLPPWLSIAFVDLDGFKHVNDRFGHHVGDELLVAVAEGLRSRCHEDDVLARLGGDEFVLVRHGADEPSCTIDREEILAAVTTPIDRGGHRVPVGASIGIATSPSSASSSSTLPGAPVRG